MLLDFHLRAQQTELDGQAANGWRDTPGEGGKASQDIRLARDVFPKHEAKRCGIAFR